ncbi:OLC1v1008896C1 [Oldenlandia corymbosa var. corymbosa]|uniref:OLC1v1008896C1 n=1 Tax=Oldenlandia corymbosa var. corymbosa TaxID=529605 RepID=A0AAV1DMZ6_OLDCO|nr:OLC1v1008896C1 [Oldenlandia corymbosa var. corymbosa]
MMFLLCLFNLALRHAPQAPLSFVDFLLEKLMELGSCESETKSRSFLEDIVESRHENQELQDLWDHILELLFKVEHFIDYLVVGDISFSFCVSLVSIMKDMRSIKLKIDFRKPKMKLKRVDMTRDHLSSQRILSFKTEVVGYLDEAKSIELKLTRGPKQLWVVTIVGYARTR